MCCERRGSIKGSGHQIETKRLQYGWKNTDYPLKKKTEAVYAPLKRRPMQVSSYTHQQQQQSPHAKLHSMLKPHASST